MVYLKSLRGGAGSHRRPVALAARGAEALRSDDAQGVPVSRGLSPDAYEALRFQPFEGHSALEVMGLLRSGHGAKGMYKIVGGNDLLPRAFATRLAGPDSAWSRRGSHRAGRQRRPRDLPPSGYPPHRLSRQDDCTIPFPGAAPSGDYAPLVTAKASGDSGDGVRVAIAPHVQVRQRYWRDQGANDFATADIPGEIWDATFDRPGQRGLLQLYLQGSSS